CALAPGTGVRVSVHLCAQPSTARKRDEGAIALAEWPAVLFDLRHPAIVSGDTWGVGHGTGNGHPPGGGSGREIPDLAHEPSNWSSANRPDDRRGGSSHRNSSASRSPSGIGGRSRVS